MAKYFKDVPQERSGGIVGRTDLVTRAVDLLGRNEDVAFVGLGGVGKSALASRLAREDAVRPRSFFTFTGTRPRPDASPCFMA